MPRRVLATKRDACLNLAPKFISVREGSRKICRLKEKKEHGGTECIEQ